MTRVRFLRADGSLDKEVEADAGQRLLDVAWAAREPLEGACEGVMACSTCHVIVDAADFERLPPASEEEDLLDLATTLIDKKAGKFDAGEFHDRYVDALKELIERKRKGRKISTEDEDEKPASRGSNVIDLMAALKKSLEKPGAKTGASASSSSSSSSRSTAKKPASRKSAPARKTAARKRA